MSEIFCHFLHKTYTVPLPVGVAVGKVSDGYHTFDELYHHRCLLFIALMHSHQALSWKSRLHDDGTSFGDWFIAGMHLPTGDVTYHMPAWLWTMVQVQELPQAPAWDGHTPVDVVRRLTAWLPTLVAEECP